MLNSSWSIHAQSELLPPLVYSGYNYPGSLTPETTYVVQPTKRKGGDAHKVIIIPVETADFITGEAHSAFVTTRSGEELEDSLNRDGGATCTLELICQSH